ncbi:hypothetical protein C8R46DRAFT_246132 [Mycena filopes]|nr:hypothetical protein C8R46DRAFT_246132 [Mycena filopes]
MSRQTFLFYQILATTMLTFSAFTPTQTRSCTQACRSENPCGRQLPYTPIGRPSRMKVRSWPRSISGFKELVSICQITPLIRPPTSARVRRGCPLELRVLKNAKRFAVAPRDAGTQLCSFMKPPVRHGACFFSPLATVPTTATRSLRHTRTTLNP